MTDIQSENPPPVEMMQTITKVVNEVRKSNELGSDLIAGYLAEISDYASLQKELIDQDVLPTSIALVDRLLTAIETGCKFDSDLITILQNSAVRRFHQGVSIEGLLHSYRLWGRVVWQEIQQKLDRSQPDTMEASLAIASRTMSFVDEASGVVARAYIAELTGTSVDRSIIRGEVLDALLGAQAVSVDAERRAVAIGATLTGVYAVVVVRGPDLLHAGSAGVRRTIATIRSVLRPREDRLTLGVRSNEIVAIYPVAADEAYEDLRRSSDSVAGALPGAVIGVGRQLRGLTGIALSYGEAAEAAAFGDSIANHGRATHFRDVLFDHIARATKYSTAVIRDFIDPLKLYDLAHGTTLVETFHAFYESRYSFARCAELLHVHPNTVSYRMRRIEELTRLNLSESDDLLLMSLSFKIYTLHPEF